MLDSAGTTSTVFPATSGWGTAFWARFAAATGEVLAMLIPVALLAKGNSIGDVEAKFWIFSPFLDVMCMEKAVCSTILACVIVAFIYFGSPFPQLSTKAGTFSQERFSVFPSCCQRSNLALAGTAPRAERLGEAGIRKERFFTHGAGLLFWRIPAAPALLGTIARRIGAVSFDLKLLPAHRTYLCGAFSSGLASVWGKAFWRAVFLILRMWTKLATTIQAGIDSFQSYTHDASIAQHANISKYCAVILERMAGMGLEPKRVEK